MWSTKINNIYQFLQCSKFCVFLHFTELTRYPRKLESHSNQAISPSCVQNPSLQRPMAFCFQTQGSIHGAHLCNLPTPAGHLLIHPLPLASRTPLSWFSDFADCFFSALFFGATSKYRVPWGAVLRPPLLSNYTHLLIPEMILSKSHGFKWHL